MGAIHVTVAIVNPGDPQKRWEGIFLVATGATDCLIPGKQLRSIGIEPRSKRVFELADGTEVVMEIGVAQIEFISKIVGATVIFGKDDAEPLLSVLRHWNPWASR